MSETLSLAYRPQSFQSMIGAEKLIKSIRGHIVSGRIPKAWLFSGETGCGKTTVARILALSLQCSHQAKGFFGTPCIPCRRDRTSFDILEINASEVSGVQDIGKIAESSLYAPRPPSQYRVFILDEAQRMSTDAQNLLLKYFEDCPKSTIWIICTTNAQKILRPLKGRCVYYELGGLKPDGVKKLVSGALLFAKSSLDAGPLVDALMEQGVWNPRHIVMAVEKYLAGNSPQQSAIVDSVEITTNTLEICRVVTSGKWQELRKMLDVTPPDESRAIAQAVMGYLSKIILTSNNQTHVRASAEGIQKLSGLGYLDDGMRRPALMAILYGVTQGFGGKRREEVDDDE